jgi:histone H3/H4
MFQFHLNCIKHCLAPFVQDFARDNKMMVGSDAYDAVNTAILNMLKEASSRCKANKRKTLKAYDF